MFGFFRGNDNYIGKIAILEKKIDVLEKKIAILEKNGGSVSVKKTETTGKAKKSKKLTAEEAKKIKRQENLQKKIEASINEVVKITGWEREFVEAKWVDSHKCVKCTPKEFVLYKLYELPQEEQKKFYLACYQKVLQDKYNTNKEFTKMLYDKGRTNTYFSEYVRRPWCVNTKASYEEFVKVFKDSTRIIYKPNAGHRGYGIESFQINTNNMKEVYEELAGRPEGVVEEFINQHPLMSSLSPSSVNSLRFVTICSKNKVFDNGKKWDVAYSIVRIGRGNSIVDNLHSGGMVSNVDMETGTLATDGADRAGNMFVVHPETGTKIKGFKIPYFKEALDMVIEAIEKNHVEGYIGWDIAISENGPMLLEVNDRPGSDGLQTAWAQEGKGMKYVMEKYL